MCGRAGIILLAIFAVFHLLHSPASLAGATSPPGSEIKSHFNLPSEDLDKALRDFAVQANCNISYEPSMVAGLHAPKIEGDFTASAQGHDASSRQRQCKHIPNHREICRRRPGDPCGACIFRA